MITPDTKDWTWVLGEACPECGFDASAVAATEVPDLVRANAAEWRRLLDAGAVAPGRPDAQTWSGLEYACHVRDVHRRFVERVGLMLAEDDPLFANWDQDASAEEDRYDEQDPAGVVAELEAAAEQMAAVFASVPDDAWSRPGRRSDGASFTVETIARYYVHDPIHHVWDVERQER